MRVVKPLHTIEGFREIGYLRRELRLAAKYLWALCQLKPRDWERLTFSQKVQWRCRYPDPKLDYASWVDKYAVKALVAGLFPVPRTYAAVHDPEEIVRLRLPNTFVMKATHGWNMSLLVENGIVRGGNRSARDEGRPSHPAYLRDVASAWRNSEQHERRKNAQRHYRQVNFGVMFEAYIRPVDYEVQLFLFAGRFRLALVFFRPFVFKDITYQIYDEDWKLREAATIHLAGSPPPEVAVPRPPASVFETLERLCRPIDHVRVDFLVSKGRYYFSEFTFTHNGTHGPGLIASYDAQLGRYWPR